MVIVGKQPLINRVTAFTYTGLAAAVLY
jgi:hypothetical protein